MYFDIYFCTISNIIWLRCIKYGHYHCHVVLNWTFGVNATQRLTASDCFIWLCIINFSKNPRKDYHKNIWGGLTVYKRNGQTATMTVSEQPACSDRRRWLQSSWSWWSGLDRTHNHHYLHVPGSCCAERCCCWRVGGSGGQQADTQRSCSCWQGPADWWMGSSGNLHRTPPAGTPGQDGSMVC